MHSRQIQSLSIAVLLVAGCVFLRFLTGHQLYVDIAENSSFYVYMVFFSAFIFFPYISYIATKEQELETLSYSDPLTSLYNRRYFVERLNQEIARAQRHKLPLALITVDLDNFKKINDEYGHKAGDFVLNKVGEILKNFSRTEDIICRVGGEEFNIILPLCSSQSAVVLAERIREQFKKNPVLFNNEKIKYGASFGISELNSDEDDENEQIQEKLIFEADSALYEAKECGRDCTKVYH